MQKTTAASSKQASLAHLSYS